jgi:hypothetical protein
VARCGQNWVIKPAAAGRGVQATVVGQDVAIGGPALVHVLGLRSPDGLAEPRARAMRSNQPRHHGVITREPGDRKRIKPSSDRGSLEKDLLSRHLASGLPGPDDQANR